MTLIRTRSLFAALLAVSALLPGASAWGDYFTDAPTLGTANFDTSGRGLMPLKLDLKACEIDQTATPGNIGSACKISAYATTNWPQTFPDLKQPNGDYAASYLNTAPVQSVTLDWGDGTYSTLTKHYDIDHIPSFGAAHIYKKVGVYNITALYHMVDPTAAGSPAMPIAPLSNLTGNPPPGGMSYNGSILRLGNTPRAALNEGGCHIFHYSASFTLTAQDLASLREFSLDTANYDDWVVVRVNGHLLYGGPLAGTTELQVNGGTVTYAPGKTHGCDLSTDWTFHPAANATPYLKAGANTITIDYVLADGGQLNLYFSATENPHCDEAGCSNTKTFADHQAQGAVQIYELNTPPSTTLEQNANGGVLLLPIAMPKSTQVPPLPPDLDPTNDPNPQDTDYSPYLVLNIQQAEIVLGSSTPIDWSSNGVTACTASGAWAGSEPINGSGTLTPKAAGTYTYTLTCTGPDGGITKSAVLKVDPAGTVLPPEPPPGTGNGNNPPPPPPDNGKPYVSLTVSPNPLILGSQAFLKWTSSDVTACVASGFWSGSQAGAGAQAVSPTATGTYAYTLTCSGPDGSVAKTVNLVVNPVPVTVTLTADPTTLDLTVGAPGQSTLTWTSTGATACTAKASAPDAGAKAFSGKQPMSGTSVRAYTIFGTYTYTLTCTGAGGSATQSVTVRANATPPTLDFTVSPGQIISGQGASTLTWSTTNAATCTATGAWTGATTTHGQTNVSPTTPGTYDYTLTCNGPGGEVFDTVQLTVLPPPPTLVFSATPTTLVFGRSTTLSWSSANATACTASKGWAGAQGLSGSKSVTPPLGTTEYDLTCTGPGGSVTMLADVTVNPAATLTLTASPAATGINQPIALAWKAANVSTCTASGNWTGTKAFSGNATEKATQVGNVVYTLTCSGTGGTITKSASVSIVAAPTLTFSGSPTNLILGASSALMWSTTGASSCSASGAWSGSWGTSGTTNVTPGSAGTLTYTLTCVGTGGSVSKAVTITATVPPPKPTLTFTASPSTIKLGASATLTWSSTGVTACTGTGPWNRTEPVSGSVVVTPPADGIFTYELTCTGPGGSVTQSVSVEALAPAPTLSLSISPAQVAFGGSAKLTWSTANAATCTAYGAWSGTEPTAGSHPVAPTSAGTYTYTLTCIGAGGGVQKSVTLTVLPPPPPTVSITATPASIKANGYVTVTWQSTGTTTCDTASQWPPFAQGNAPLNGSGVYGPLSAGTYNFSIACTGPGGNATDSATVTVEMSPTPTATFTINDLSSVAAEQGNAYTLAWDAKNVTTCQVVDPIHGSSNQGITGTLANRLFTSVGSFTFKLNCSGPDGTVSKTVTATVKAAPPPTLTFTLNGSTTTQIVPKGKPLAFVWSSVNTTSCQFVDALTGPATSVTSGSDTISTTAANFPTGMQLTYSVQCASKADPTNPTNFQAIQRSIAVTVETPPTATLTASPSVTTPGHNVTLTWNSDGALNCTGTSTAGGTAAGWGTSDLSGSETVFMGLTGNFVYTLTCGGLGGSVTTTATIVVNKPAPKPTINMAFNPSTAPSSANGGGAISTLTWSTTNASTCELGVPGDGMNNVSVNGSTGVLLSPGTYVYTLTCTGPGGSATDSATFTVTSQPTINFTLTPLNGNGLPFEGNLSLFTSNLAWTVTGATSCTASFAGVGGSVLASGYTWSGSKPLSGTYNDVMVAAPSEADVKQSFTLTCTGSGGSATVSAQ